MSALKNKKILMVLPSLDPSQGGVVAAVLTLSQELSRQQRIVDILTFDDPTSSWLKNQQNVIAIGPSYGKYRINISALKWMRRHHREYDAVIVNGLWQFVGLVVWIALKNTGVPYYVFPHGMLDPWFAKAYPLKHIKKSVYWWIIERSVLSSASAVLFTSADEKISAMRSFGFTHDNIIISPLGVPRPPCNLDELGQLFIKRFIHLAEKKIVLFLGRIDPKKGCDILIESFKTVAIHNPSLQLVFVGPGSSKYINQLKSLAKRIGIEGQISWLGMLSGGDKWGAYYSAQIFCLPSHQENFGIVVAEALATGTPVIISNKVNIWREIVEFNSGFVDSDSVDGTTRCLEKWLSMDKYDYRDMCVQASLCFENRFTVDGATLKLCSNIQC
jgi:glycosyltransferase involved in cell wall biosynthesis